MEILCPECGFSREVDETKIPARSQVATCPKCKAKFKFRELPEEEFTLDDPDADATQEPARGSDAQVSPPRGPSAERQKQQAFQDFTGDDDADDDVVESLGKGLDADHDDDMPIDDDLPIDDDMVRDEDLDDDMGSRLDHDLGHDAHEAPRAAKGADSGEELWDKLGDMRPPTPGHGPRTPATGSEAKTSAAPKPIPTPKPAPKPDSGPAPVREREPAPEQTPVPGWTGEFNADFPDPMDDAVKAGHDNPMDADDDSGSLGLSKDSYADDGQGPKVPPPFEQLDRYGFFPGLFMTIRLILFSPRLFFSVMPVGGGLAKPLTFAILLTMIQGLFQYFWELAGLSTTAIGPGGADGVDGFSGTAGALMMLLLMPAFIAAGQFIVTGIYHLLLILMRADSQGFEGTFRALAYANAPLIIGIFPMPTAGIEIGWMILAAMWGLSLTIIGLRHIHRAPYSKVVPVALIPLLLATIGGVMAFYSQLATI
ncbi:MAG: zinc-ribbon domain-containing protein [Pseudodesulfovibrio sp.]|uniref:MJ0042 family finger-like protein n=2 Tax=Pseudodesulfovibrio TaxID=2035811 RepID=E6VSW3_PSEA9|nr:MULTISPECIES: YIP1 family protein [Pseudodesulfovibrio]MBU4192486.1 zinc-ribbon domain-containing protein [Pseudomonadota bacterium]ADU63207.1 hypothetical protein Daes_2201 [Pseudodesulfovibrio aespoeensis Aspo-2]MBU4243271.1 zinc-ribbon domain-containing protein [Pseudomonadota bacterium]MBU4475104.1 zinc-ribbon domain-containing protein [Pseudomonadota bacterium]MBU4517144.1 zinc-ribbon domain-containing protein [Pseudomonadota bacterium]